MRPLTFLLGAALVLAAWPAAAEDYTVNTLVDYPDPTPGDGMCGVLLRDGTRLCTLRAAIQEANAIPGGDHVIFLGPGIHYLWFRGSDENFAATGDLDVAGSVSIVGSGPAGYSCPDDESGSVWRRGCVAGTQPTVISARNGDRVFHVLRTGTLSINGVTITGGRAPRRHVPVFTPDSVGGGILNEGNLGLHGFETYATTSLYEASVLGNRAQRNGGGIASFTALHFSSGEVAGNRAGIDGGGIWIDRPSRFGVGADLGQLLVRANLATGVMGRDGRLGAGQGGGIAAHGVLRTRHIELRTNTANEGGGLWIGGNAFVRLGQSTVAGNRARLGGGGIKAELEGDADVELSHSTISGNSAARPGGGIDNRGSSASDAEIFVLASVTLTDNSSERNDGANIFSERSTIVLRNTIVSAPEGGPNCTLHGIIAFEGTNLEDRGDCGFPATQSFTDPLLAPLADNGGFARTHALDPASPAIDRVAIADCDPEWAPSARLLDERGLARPQGTGCDIGAFEVDLGVPDWIGDIDGLIGLLFLSSEVVATSLDVQLKYGNSQDGAAIGPMVEAAKALDTQVTDALHVSDRQQGLALLRTTVKQSLGALQQTMATAEPCCRGLDLKLPYLVLVRNVEAFALSLQKVSGPPTPGDNPGQ